MDLYKFEAFIAEAREILQEEEMWSKKVLKGYCNWV